jgi:hypothetical protein
MAREGSGGMDFHTGRCPYIISGAGREHGLFSLKKRLLLGHPERIRPFSED